MDFNQFNEKRLKSKLQDMILKFVPTGINQWRIQARGGGGGSWGACAFYKSEDNEHKISIKPARNLSQNTRNGHFRDSNFQKCLGEHALQRPP